MIVEFESSGLIWVRFILFVFNYFSLVFKLHDFSNYQDVSSVVFYLDTKIIKLYTTLFDSQLFNTKLF